MKIRLLALITLIFLLFSTLPLIQEIEAEESDPDAFGYKYIDSEDPEPVLECEYFDIKSDEDVVGWDTSNWEAMIQADLGFSFSYYGSSFSKVYVSTYGAMSFTQNSASSFRYYSSKRIPSTSSPVGIIAPYWTWNNCYTTSSDRLFTLQTEIDGEKVFVVEWNPQQGGKFQVILYQGGMIKFQIESVPRSPVGSYATMGIEKSDGSTGIEYISYNYQSTDLFSLPFAMAFVLDDVEIKSVKLTNGDGRNGDTVYAGSKFYKFSVEARHSSGGQKITHMFLTLGSLYDQEMITLQYSHKNKTFSQITGKNNLNIIYDQCSWSQNGNYLTIDFVVDFSMTYPSQEMRNVTAKVTGKSAVPAYKDVGEIYRVETEVEWDPSELHVERVSDQRHLLDGDHVAGMETIRFTGLRVYYENSDVQPRPTLFNLEIEDNYGMKKEAYIQQDSMLDLTWTTIDETTLMIWEITTVGFPQFSMLSSEPIEFSLAIDTDKPDEVPEVRVYSDSLEEEPSDNDNDGKVFVKWEPAQDGGSGIGEYLVKVESDDYILEKMVSKNTNSTVMGQDNINGIPEGIANISVTPIDDVGNIGPATWTMFKIDMTGPSYEVVDPVPGEWAMSTKPTISVRITDELTGVYGESLEYRVSKDGGYTFEDWTSFYYFGNSNDVTKTIDPVLQEGTNNILEIRSTDIAGSEQTTSEQFSIWVDARAPKISMSQPVVDENGTTINWLRSTDEPLRIKIHDWRGSGIDPTGISYKVSTDGGETFSADVQLEGEGYNNSQGFFEYAFNIRNDDWDQGSDNLLVVDAYDMIGRHTTKSFRIKFDVEPEYQIISPLSITELGDNESIAFIIDVNDPDGNDDLTVTWMSNIDGLLGVGTSLDLYMSPGDHIIQVTIEDGVHSIKKIFTISVRASILDDPRYKDSDGDGMNDSFEKSHGLNPLANDADNDLDGDGHTNIMEYYSNTDPADKNQYPGSEIFEEEFPITPIIILIIALVILILAGILVIRESNKSKKSQMQMMSPAPPLPVGYQTGQQNLGPNPELPALPPPTN